MSQDIILKALEGIESKLKSMDEKAAGEISTLGKVSADTKSALETLGNQQREFADRLLGLEQKGALRGQEGNEGAKGEDSIGAQFVKTGQVVGKVRFSLLPPHPVR